MNPSGTSIRSLLGSLGLLTGLVGCGSDGGTTTPTPTPDSGGPPTGCFGNAVACEAGPNSYPDASPSDAAEEAYIPPCGNAAICDAGPLPNDASTEAAAEASVDSGGFDGHFGCGTGNGPVCPTDASE
jgi:hypothetical protein